MAITSQFKPAQTVCEVVVQHWQAAGLIKPSVLKPLITTIERALVLVNDDVHRRVEELLSRHSLRGADAIHLASATLIRDALQQSITFACADAKLVTAACAESLDIVP